MFVATLLNPLIDRISCGAAVIIPSVMLQAVAAQNRAAGPEASD